MPSVVAVRQECSNRRRAFILPSFASAPCKAHLLLLPTRSRQLTTSAAPCLHHAPLCTRRAVVRPTSPSPSHTSVSALCLATLEGQKSSNAPERPVVDGSLHPRGPGCKSRLRAATAGASVPPCASTSSSAVHADESRVHAATEPLLPLEWADGHRQQGGRIDQRHLVCLDALVPGRAGQAVERPG